MVPILIGFLASVIGIGGIGQKIRQIVETLQKPVNKALDFVIKTGLKLAGPIIRGIKGFAGKVKAKVAAGKAWVKGKAEAGKAWGKSRLSGSQATDDLTPAVRAAEAILSRPRVDRAAVFKVMPHLKSTYSLSAARVVTENDGAVRITVQRTKASTASHIIERGLSRARIHAMIREIANELLASKAVKESVQKILEDRAKGLGASVDSPRPSRGKLAESSGLVEAPRRPGQVEVISQAPGFIVTERQTRTSHPGHIHVLDLGGTGKYDPDIKSAISAIKRKTGATDGQIATAIREADAGKIPGPPIDRDPAAVAYLFRLARLEAVESGRSPSHLVGSAMAHDVTGSKADATAEKMITDLNPMALEGAGSASRRVSRDEGVPHASPSKSVGSGDTVEKFVKREMALAVAYVETIFDKEYKGEFSEKELDHIIRHQLRDRLEQVGRAASSGPT
jgi:hypothetical protein